MPDLIPSIDELLRRQFRDVVRDEAEMGWRATCPRDSRHTVFFNPRGGLLGDCSGGCTAQDVIAALNEDEPARLREPGSDDGDEQPPRAQRFQLEPLSRLLAEQIPPTKWLLTPYVPACSFGELVGPPGKGKTTLMAWMIMQMAKAGYRCAIIEEEGSRRGLQRLLGRAKEAVGGDVGDRVSFMHAQHVSLLDPRDIRILAEILKGQDFVLLDSFNLVTPGLDEDKAAAMGPVIRDLRWLRDTLQIAVWLNHHSGKSMWKSGEIPKLGDGRGSSALPGALDAELSMRPIEESEEGFIQFDLFVTKMREADDQVKPRRVSIARAGPAAVAEMSDLDDTAAVAPATKRSGAVDRIIDKLLKDVRVPTSFAAAKSWGKILEELQVRREDGFKARAAVLKTERFVEIKEKPFSRYYRVPNDAA
jgi:hypothetical protein